MLAAAGVPRIEAVSFVNPKRVPQMAGAEEVVAAIERREGVVYAGLALNERGYERLRATGLDEVALRLRGNRGVQPPERERIHRGGLVDAAADPRARDRDGIRSTVTIGVAFGCPFEGAVDPGRVAELAARLADPARTRSLSRTPSAWRAASGPRPRRPARNPRRPVGIHLHNTRNIGFANAYAALEAGATVFDASVGGIGGARSRRGRRATSRPRISSTSPRRGHRDGHRPRRAHRRGAVARITARARARGPGLQSRRVRSGLRLGEKGKRTWRTGWGSTSAAPRPTSSSYRKATAARSSASRRRRRGGVIDGRRTVRGVRAAAGAWAAGRRS